jgi:hypothetical protein
MAASAMPALLLPLSEETRIVEGGDEALRISIALREALGSEGNCVVLRSRPGFASALVSTVEGVFGVRVFECGFHPYAFVLRAGSGAPCGSASTKACRAPGRLPCWAGAA